MILEVDEHYHRHRDPREEVLRYGELQGSMPRLPQVFIRYNPGVRSQAKMVEVLRDALRSGGAAAIAGGGIHLTYVGYPQARIDELNAVAVELLGAEIPHAVVK